MRWSRPKPNPRPGPSLQALSDARRVLDVPAALRRTAPTAEQRMQAAVDRGLVMANSYFAASVRS